ncbi:hypothetical protein BC939DRAFT_181060 [Gamsiella multidivaricata]|uniref:uncharacterized protein n=1 Tax=Gamsiella multidivaricata TaxID=101098 RepID=UPI00221FF517|nr:uncharacterized protein BC939DRAFT_181060 [Gamsiella multidivaricata]KAI7822594.1 hypothetical protein BC939DRAFT_181060 [Gamsiella multidivaricata]
MVHTKQIQSSSLLAHISHMPRAEQQVDNSSSQQTVHPARYPTLTGDQVLGSRWSNSEGLDGEFGVSSQYSTYTMGDASTCTNNPCIITQQWSTTQQKTTFCRQLPTPTQAPQNPVYSLNASAVQTKEQYSACLLARHSLSSGQGDAHASQTVQGLARHSTAYPPATSLFASKHADDTAFLSDFVNFEECEASCSSESSSGKTVENSVHQPSHSVGAHNVRTSHYPPFVQSAQGSLLVSQRLQHIFFQLRIKIRVCINTFQSLPQQ